MKIFALRDCREINKPRVTELPHVHIICMLSNKQTYNQGTGYSAMNPQLQIICNRLFARLLRFGTRKANDSTTLDLLPFGLEPKRFWLGGRRGAGRDAEVLAPATYTAENQSRRSCR